MNLTTCVLCGGEAFTPAGSNRHEASFDPICPVQELLTTRTPEKCGVLVLGLAGHDGLSAGTCGIAL